METGEKSERTGLELVREISPEMGEYTELFIEMMAEYETNEYAKKPERIVDCFPQGLDADQNELLAYIDTALENDIPKAHITAALLALRETLTHKPVTLFALEPIFRHAGVSTQSEDKSEENDGPIRFKMANLHVSPRELSEFHAACGLIEDIAGGKGGHHKWRDPDSGIITVDSTSKFLWLKNDIKLLLAAGFPVERIAAACKKLKIDFEVITV